MYNFLRQSAARIYCPSNAICRRSYDAYRIRSCVVRANLRDARTDPNLL